MVIGPILALFFLCDSGFAFEVTNNPKLNSFPLSLNSIEDVERHVYLEQKIWFRYVCPTEQEVLSAKWLGQLMDKRQTVYATYWDIRVPALIAYGSIPQEQTTAILPPGSNQDIRGGYVYLGYVNVVFGYGVTNNSLLPEKTYKIQIWDISHISPLLHNSVKVYTNGASEVYWSP
jgi:uncharacterized membrane protein